MDPHFSDPGWFPANYIASSDEFRMIALDIETVGSASFLDRRMQAGLQSGISIKAETAKAATSSAVPAFLFHTAFCGSTLLARALHAPLAAVSLKEPSVLLDLSAASLAERSSDSPERLDQRLTSATTLLSRPWAAGGRVLIKPTNQVNRIMLRLLQVQPEARALLLYSSLEEFLVSCFKKLPLAETRVRWMAQHLLVGSDLAKRLGIPPLHAFSLPESCVFTWYAQIERYAKALDSDLTDKLRTLDLQSMLKEPLATVGATANWLALYPALEGMEQRVAYVFERDSKATHKQYSPMQRQADKKAITDKFGDVIARTLHWAKIGIEPYALLPRDWKSLSLDKKN